MGVELLDTAPVFAEQMSACAEAFAEFVDWSLIDVLRGAPGAPGLDRVDVVQPALFAVMVSLAELWRVGRGAPGRRDRPFAGRDRRRLRRRRAVAARRRPGGDAAQQAAAGAGRPRRDGVARRAAPSRRGNCWRPTAIGSASPRSTAGRRSWSPAKTPRSTSSSRLCTERELRARRIDVDYASHSVAVEAIRDELAEALAGIEPQSTRTVFFSTVTGSRLDTAGLDADYWYRNIRQTVRIRPGGAQRMRAAATGPSSNPARIRR